MLHRGGLVNQNKLTMGRWMKWICYFIAHSFSQILKDYANDLQGQKYLRWQFLTSQILQMESSDGLRLTQIDLNRIESA